jgi:hypothetical protein
MMTRSWGRWAVRIGLVIIALFVFICAALLIWKPGGVLLMVALLLAPLLSNGHPPPVADGVITAADWLHWEAAGRKLTSVLEKEFPVGTPEAALRSVLLGQGFKPANFSAADCVVRGQPVVGRAVCPDHDSGTSLEYGWGNGICGETITIWWTTDAGGKITRVGGSYHGVCL